MQQRCGEANKYLVLRVEKRANGGVKLCEVGLFKESSIGPSPSKKKKKKKQKKMEFSVNGRTDAKESYSISQIFRNSRFAHYLMPSSPATLMTNKVFFLL